MKTFSIALLIFIASSGLAILGQSPAVAGSVEQDSATTILQMDRRHAARKAAAVKEAVNSKTVPIPDNVLWRVVFGFTTEITKKGNELSQRGENGGLYSDYFVRQGPLSSESDQQLKSVTAQYAQEVTPIDERLRQLIATAKASSGERSTELKELQTQKNEIALRYRDVLKATLGPDIFERFSSFLTTEFSTGTISGKIPTGDNPDGIEYYGYSVILWDDSQEPPLVSGYSYLELTYYFPEYHYDPSLDSWLLHVTPLWELEFGSDTGYQDVLPAEWDHGTYFSNRGEEYCVEGHHYADLYDGGTLVDEIDLGITDDCHTVAQATPTPTPPVTPTPTPGCGPSNEDPCPPPSPAPTPVITIADVPLVEKFGTRDVAVTVSGLTGSNQAIFTLHPLTGSTGEAKFDNNTTEIRTGNGSYTLHIKGTLESSAANQMTIEATTTSTSGVLKHKEFTVAVITSLIFERINSDDIALNENPGTDGVVNPDGSEGLRIYPDRNTPSDTTDRATVRFKATVSPTIPNVKVYFASFDLDDPSATGLPIDSTGTDGIDNNGAVNGSKSGGFSNPNRGSCLNAIAGTTPLYVSKVECSATGTPPISNVISGNFTVTMQPGDNFAVGASLVDTYRDSLRVDTTAGANIVNATSQTVSISGSGNPNGIQGIRTRMLTVWRKLHLEVDSMGNVGAGNNVTGTVVTNGGKLSPGVHDIEIIPSNGHLDFEQFENGRVVIAGRAYTVLENLYTQTGTDVLRIRVMTTVTIANGAAFTLYDDDDYNADDGAAPDGDYNEAIAQLPESFKYIAAEDGVNSSGHLKNLYSQAYIMPEYNWAQTSGYNQTNLPFSLNVPDDPNLDNVINANRDTKLNCGTVRCEADAFWIAYILVAYQGDTGHGGPMGDADGYYFNSSTGTYEAEGGVEGISRMPTIGCDCYQNAGCIGTGCNSAIPTGAFGSLIFEEVMQDVTRTWLRVGNLVVENQGLTAPHEIGHQFGLRGDNKPNRTTATYGLMDYPHRLPPQNETDDYNFHPEHINIMRKRVTSPGE